MSFQAYLDNIEDKAGLTPRQFLELAHERGLDAPALVHVIQKGPQISAKHVDSGGTHSDPKDHLWLDGKASKPEGY
jgi:hypothetical protein